MAPTVDLAEGKYRFCEVLGADGTQAGALRGSGMIGVPGVLTSLQGRGPGCAEFSAGLVSG